ncbi:unnamed protein product, partial [Sphenostylis stenocarpa]
SKESGIRWALLKCAGWILKIIRGDFVVQSVGRISEALDEFWLLLELFSLANPLSASFTALSGFYFSNISYLPSNPESKNNLGE